MSKIYKYFSNNVIELVFQKKGFCGIKCSLPQDYNDPYELFLGMDLNTPAEQLAFYNDIISGIPQSPTTCFSKSPIVSPMWAHYANNHTGFVLEFDLDKLQEHFIGNPIWDVTYRNAPSEHLQPILQRAAVLKKPRHSYALQEYVFVESYFAKYDDWKYEQECRFVDMKKVSEKVAGNDILYIPSDLVTSIIIGSKYPKENINLTKEIAKKNELTWYELVIGKSHPKPYMKNESGNVFTFSQSDILIAPNTCNSCLEPLVAESDLCPWCSITEAHKDEAARSNPFRMLSSMGQLDSYMKAMSKIGK